MKKFTPEEDQFILDNYLTKPMKHISRDLGRAESSARQRLHRLGFVVPPEIADQFRKKYMFQKGSVSHNKGKKVSPEVYAKMKPTMFKKGAKPHNTKENGAINITKDGYIEIRVAPGDYRLKHRLVWEAENGPIPDGFIIIFKDQNKQNVDIGNLEMISMGENAIRNKVAPNYPREIQKVEYTRVKLNSKIKKYGKEQTIRS